MEKELKFFAEQSGKAERCQSCGMPLAEMLRVGEHRMKRLRLGAVLHFIIAICHLGCLFALDEAFDAYGIKDVMHNMVFGHVWMLYALTFCLALAFAFALAGLYALSASGDIRRLPLTRMAIIVIIMLYSFRALAGGWACVVDFNWLRFFSSVILAFIAWCYYPGKKNDRHGNIKLV